MKNKIRIFFILCIPIFLLYWFFGQIQSTHVIDLHNEIYNTPGINRKTNDKSFMSLGTILIPGSEPFIEIMSIAELMVDISKLNDDYSTDSITTILNNAKDSYISYTSTHTGSLFTKNYEDTLYSLILYYDGLNTYGEDSELVEKLRYDFLNSLEEMKIIAIVKVCFFILMFVSSLIGFVFYKVNLKGSRKQE